MLVDRWAEYAKPILLAGIAHNHVGLSHFFQHAALMQMLQRVSHRGAADVKHLGQRRLRRQRRAHMAAGNGFQHLIDDVLAQILASAHTALRFFMH